MRTRVSLLIAFMALVLGARVARAEEDVEALIRQGNALRKQGDNARAYGYFKRAYEAAHTARSAAQLGLAEQSLGRFEDAERHLSEALAGSDPWIDQNRATLEETRKAARASLGRIEVPEAPSGTTIAIGGRAPVAIPSDGIVWAKPGEVSVQVSAPGRDPVARTVTVSAGGVKTIELPKVEASAKTETPKLATIESPPPSVTDGTTAPSPAAGADTTDGGATLRIAGIVAAGVGAAVGIAGVFVYRAGAAKLDDIKDDATNKRPYDPANDNYKTLGNAGIAMMVGGGVALAAGAALYVVGLNQRGDSADATTRAAVDVAPGGGFLVRLSGRF